MSIYQLNKRLEKLEQRAGIKGGICKVHSDASIIPIYYRGIDDAELTKEEMNLLVEKEYAKHGFTLSDCNCKAMGRNQYVIGIISPREIKQET